MGRLRSLGLLALLTFLAEGCGASATAPWPAPSRPPSPAEGFPVDAGSDPTPDPVADGGLGDGGPATPETPARACLLIGGLDRIRVAAELDGGCLQVQLVTPGGPPEAPDVALPEGWGLEGVFGWSGTCADAAPWEERVTASRVAGIVVFGDQSEWGYPADVDVDVTARFGADTPFATEEVHVRASGVPVEEPCP